MVRREHNPSTECISSIHQPRTNYKPCNIGKCTWKQIIFWSWRSYFKDGILFFVVFFIPFNVSIRALYVAKNPRYLSIPIQTNKFPVPRKIEQKSQRSPVVFLVSSISVITDPVINSKSLIQIRTYLKNHIVLIKSPGEFLI